MRSQIAVVSIRYLIRPSPRSEFATLKTQILRRELEREILRKALTVAMQLFVEAFRGYLINGSEIAIEHDLLFADRENSNLWRLVFHAADSASLSRSTNQPSR
jgi:hypothetical protein